MMRAPLGRLTPLTGGAEAANFSGDSLVAVRFVLRPPALCSTSPQPERTGLKLATHQFNHVAWTEPKLRPYGIETGAIFPGHHDHSTRVGLT